MTRVGASWVRSRRERAWLMVGALLLAGCGTASGPGDGPADGDLPTWTAQDPDLLLTGHGLVLQEDGRPPELCVGGVAESYPPQCGGPELVGFSWDDVPEHEESAGVTWGPATVVGTFDGHRLHLTQPASPEPPEDGTAPDGTDFPQLCEDPFRGGDEDWRQDPGAQQAMDALGRELESLDGYVTSWVSDGRDMYNVVVTDDPEVAHRQLREVWPGGLCVEQRDLPTQQQVRTAQERVNQIREEIGLLSSGGGGGDGLLHVGVLVADEPTVARVHQVVGPQLSPDQVVVEGALRPVSDGR